MAKNVSLKPLAVALGTAFAASVGATSVANAADNPFGVQPLSNGYMVAGEHMKDGSCGEARCGADKARMKKTAMEEGADHKEGSCGGDKMKKEGSCGGDKMKEGSCGGDKMKEGSCGGDKMKKEGSCGGDKMEMDHDAE